MFARSGYDAIERSFQGVTDIDINAVDGELVEGKVPLRVTVSLQSKYVGDSSAIRRIFRSRMSSIASYAGVSRHLAIPVDNDFNMEVKKEKRTYLVSFNMLGISRHPGQVYEAIYAFILFLLLFHIYYHHLGKFNNGLLFGIFITVLFALRIVDEGFKENQEAFEEGMLYFLNR